MILVCKNLGLFLTPKFAGCMIQFDEHIFSNQYINHYLEKGWLLLETIWGQNIMFSNEVFGRRNFQGFFVLYRYPRHKTPPEVWCFGYNVGLNIFSGGIWMSRECRCPDVASND